VKHTAQSGGKSAAQSAAPAQIDLSYKFPLAPCAHQHAALQRILDDQRYLYNAALEERIGAYRWEREWKWVNARKRSSAAEFEEARRAARRATSKNGQSAQLTEIRDLLPEYDDVAQRISRGTLQRLDKAYEAFFRRVKQGGPPGFPKFKPARFFNTLEANDVSGWSVKRGNWLFVKGVPGLMRIRMHRPLPGAPKALRLTRKVNIATGKAKWWVSFAVNVPAADAAKGKPAIGVDVGVRALAACSDEEIYERAGEYQEVEKEIRRLQKSLDPKRKAKRKKVQRGSREWKRRMQKKRKLYARIANIRENHGHHVANAIVGRAGLVAVEKLNVKGMMAKGGAHKRGLNRALGDVAVSDLLKNLHYKADRAGVEFVEVNPRGTSQECSGCGAVVKKGLEVRVHNCPECGLKLDRDVNAARNILQRALQGKEGAAQ